jgi:hypothetical protein
VATANGITADFAGVGLGFNFLATGAGAVFFSVSRGSRLSSLLEASLCGDSGLLDTAHRKARAEYIAQITQEPCMVPPNSWSFISQSKVPEKNNRGKNISPGKQKPQRHSASQTHIHRAQRQVHASKSEFIQEGARFIQIDREEKSI